MHLHEIWSATRPSYVRHISALHLSRFEPLEQMQKGDHLIVVIRVLYNEEVNYIKYKT